jgi:hypothetical protein
MNTRKSNTRKINTRKSEPSPKDGDYNALKVFANINCIFSLKKNIFLIKRTYFCKMLCNSLFTVLYGLLNLS